MYPPIRDLFCDFLGYPRSAVLTDIAGEEGRPDLTIRAPSGMKDSAGRNVLIDWIVVEAKDEHTAFSAPDRRENIFTKKVKYVGPDTDWFVMCDPTVIVARNVRSPDIAADNDIVFRLDGSETEAAFRATFQSLAFDVAGVPARLRAFREGNPRGIACEKLLSRSGATQREINRVTLARRNFYSTLRRTTRQLQEATLAALRGVKPVLDETVTRANAFAAKYEVCEFTAYPLSVRGTPRSFEKTKTHDRDASTLRRFLAKQPILSRLALQGLPDFKNRTGLSDEGKMLELFATETANLILARILLVRFLEDHGFFGERKYVCNGGVKAFREVMTYFGHGYTKLLEEAYRSASRLYAAAFDETELDWIFAADDERLSSAVEWAMYQLSRYDFTTVKGDILTGIYDRFLDKKQRKAFGEYYTPPSIARYILDRLRLSSDARVLDPACGSGTFLIERYQQVVGEDADRGLALYADAVAALDRVAGNDINTFSAVLAQIQLLWHLLVFRDELLLSEFPEINVSEKANSLARTSVTETAHHRFTEMDAPDYDAVVGNPPYVRSERGSALDHRTREYFSSSRQKLSGLGSWAGISPEGNVFGLFIYRAMDSWCRQPNRYGDGAGRLGFVIPLSFCGNDDNAPLRALFGPEGRWTIRELVDIEAIWRYVFDGDVLPLIFIAEARPPRLPLKEEWLLPGAALPSDTITRRRVRRARLDQWMQRRQAAAEAAGQRDMAERWAELITRNRPSWLPDQVSIRLADRSCLEFHDGEKRPHFALDQLPENLVDYADIFAPDGRILTRMTPARRRIIDRLSSAGRLEQAALRYWVRKAGSRIVEASTTPPPAGATSWSERKMITRGLVFRGSIPTAIPGMPVYKGENILSCSLFGTPQAVGVNTSAVNDPSIWRYPNILPNKMFAVAMIMTCPSALAFNPKEIAFTDTVTLFAPAPEFSEFPFDLLFMSRIYAFHHVLACRMSFLNNARSHIYPTNLRLLPWSHQLAERAKDIEALRDGLLGACASAFATKSAMQAELSRVNQRSFRDVVRASGGRVEWSESLQPGQDKITILAVPPALADEGWRVQVSELLFDWVEPTDRFTADALYAALSIREGEEFDREKLLGLMVPADPAALEDYRGIIERFQSEDHNAALEARIDALDAIVGAALGLTPEEITDVRREMMEDALLRRVRPRYPQTQTRLHGFRTGLDSSDRYTRSY